MVRKGGGWGCARIYRILYSIAYTVRAVGGTRDVTSLKIECHSEKKRHNIPRVCRREMFCSFSSRLKAIVFVLRHATVFTM